jgi:hypothetical protein
MLLTVVLTELCGGNCPSGNCPDCYCGTSKLKEDIAKWCAKYSWKQECCKCIVEKGSGGNAHFLSHYPNGSTDVGLFQVNNVNVGVCRSIGDSAIAAGRPATRLRT